MRVLHLTRRMQPRSSLNKVINYNAPISAYDKGEYLQEAHLTWEMYLRGLLRAVITYNWKISACGKGQHPRGAMHL